MKTLKDHYQDVVKRGWTRQSFSCWRGSVIRRINKMYSTNYKNLSDEEIVAYLDRAKFFNLDTSK